MLVSDPKTPMYTLKEMPVLPIRSGKHHSRGYHIKIKSQDLSKNNGKRPFPGSPDTPDRVVLSFRGAFRENRTICPDNQIMSDRSAQMTGMDREEGRRD